MIAGLAFLLRPIEGQIGILDQRLRFRAVVWRAGDTDARVDRHLLSPDHHGLVEAVEKLLGMAQHIFVRFDIGDHHRELIAALTRHNRPRHEVGQAPRNLFQNSVARRMAGGVVDQFEIVEIKIADRHSLAIRHAGKGGIELFGEQLPIG